MTQRYGSRTIKIDQYFISKISALNDKDLLTADIFTMSHKLGLKVVAEGVETSAQYETLNRMGCAMIQGFYIGEAEPVG